MKSRKGFVSNSSSSSFILPIKDEDHVVSLQFSMKDLTNLLKSSDESSIYGVIKTENDLAAYIIDRHGSRNQTLEEVLNDEYEGEFATEQYNKLKELLDKGHHIMLGSIDYHEQLASELITAMGGTVED